jgi:hypothetical protein
VLQTVAIGFNLLQTAVWVRSGQRVCCNLFQTVSICCNLLQNQAAVAFHPFSRREAPSLRSRQ